MKKGIVEPWVELFRSLGESLLEVLGAEASALGKELQESGKEAGIGAAFFAAAGAVLFWFVAVLTLFLVAILAIWLPTWAAAGIVALLLLLLAGGLAGLGWLRLRRLESPTRTVARRWEDHRSWWEGSLLAAGQIEEGSGTERSELDAAGSEETEEEP